jgi:hypothetical protein
MTTTADPARRFSADMLAGVDEPVRRYFTHTITDGAPLPDGVHMAMRGHIKVGLWLPFTAEQTVDGRSFAWRARVGRGPLRRRCASPTSTRAPPAAPRAACSGA